MHLFFFFIIFWVLDNYSYNNSCNLNNSCLSLDQLKFNVNDNAKNKEIDNIDKDFNKSIKMTENSKFFFVF